MEVLQRSIHTLYVIFYVLILARVLMSWVRPQGGSQWLSELMQIIYVMTEPLLQPIRRLMPNTMGLDLSPIVALMLLWVFRGVVVSLF